MIAVNGVLPAARWSNVVVGDDALARSVDLEIPIGPLVQSRNGSIWADIFAVPSGRPLRDFASSQILPTLRVRKLLTRLYPQRRHREQRKLFGGSDEKESTDSEKAQALKQEEELSAFGPAPLVTFWHRNLTLGLATLDAKSALPIGKLPPPVLQHVHVQHDEAGKPTWTGEVEGHNAIAKPLLFSNDFWLLREHMNPINATLDTLPLTVNLYSTSFFKFQLITSMHDAFGKQEMGAAEVDLIKETLLTTSPWYLGLTMLVTLLHSLFEFLAFSSDVSHWRQKDNLAGVSIGSILTNVVVQLIILLYLIDQSEQTSWMILAGNGVGVLVEAWKLTKAVTVGIVPRRAENRKGPLGWLPYQLDVQNKRTPSEEELRTQKYDRQAFKICGIVMGPVLVGYTVYSALYEQHKGWWSFIIGTLCSFVYAFGFVSLIPQLLVNYNMKSVAGYPAKTMIYKILGTVVDDFFAFAIKMPWLHRLACFRDDVIFLIFLYQRYIYGVDETRVNEFGQVVNKQKEDEKDAAVDKVEDKKRQKSQKETKKMQ
ncbi:cleft lip and palate transmembrane 1 [Ceraceosorus guamensis]|uniref:Cleft lip and palate transmembrane 1 n=1 Tax=Ceraceosorus guamensis TaxID=1522189 RepID=A0A316W2Y5_9BASI|nr:cleft lip and palate transmembrane 1 [Ceraceosorus guamensis]PWN44257.1 cleft lip and palate transmembrane 1 [Ceraceosorus guamensis]